jgi:hypothetical protein
MRRLSVEFSTDITVSLFSISFSVHLCSRPHQFLNAWTNFYETWYVYHGISSHPNGVLNKSLPSVCVPVCVSSLSLLGNGSVSTFPRQRIHATVQKLFHASFSMRCLSYQRRFCGSVYPSIAAGQRLGKHVSAAKEGLLKASFSMQSVSYQKKVGHWFLLELVSFNIATSILMTSQTINCFMFVIIQANWRI